MDRQWGNTTKNVCRLCGLVYDPVTTHICPPPGSLSRAICPFCGDWYAANQQDACPHRARPFVAPTTQPKTICPFCWHFHEKGQPHVCPPESRKYDFDFDNPPQDREGDLRKMASLLTQAVAEMVYVREHATDRVQEHARRALRRVDEVAAILGRLERK